MSGKPIFYFVILLMARSAFATGPIDPSSAVLFRSSGSSPDVDDLDSDRYEVRQPPPTSTKVSAKPVAQPSPQPSPIASPLPIPSPAPSAAPSPSPSPSAVTSTANQVQVLILGGDFDSIQEYRKMLHPSDPRLNVLELSVAPTYFYLNSSSDYWARRYTTSGPMADFKANVWLSPFFGVQVSDLVSINDEISSTPTDSTTSSYAINTFNFGIRFRNFFGYSRRAGSFSFGLDYEDSQTKVDPSAVERTGFNTNGFKLVLDTNLPLTSSYATTVGIEFAPFLAHHEINGAAGSGNSAKASMIGVTLGGRYLFDRKNQFYWKVSQQFERDAFSGDAHATDPVSGIVPSGVVVNQSLTLFQIGFTWAP